MSADLRGLAVVDEDVAWASGTGGTWLRTADGGASWQSGSVAPGLDFRSIAAFSAQRALVLSAGSPARMFLTEDGGASWREVFHDERREIFFDSMAFADAQHGWAVGDPIDGRFALIATDDGGSTWRALTGPEARPREGAFAASNTCLVAVPGALWFTSSSRVFRSADGGKTWQFAVVDAPTVSTAGVFSLAMRADGHGAVTGGDYKQPDAPGFVAYTSDGGVTWRRGPPPPGYRSAVALHRGAVVVTGPSGTDWSPDGREAFRPLGDGFNAVAFSGRAGYAVGPKGRVARLREP